MPSDGKFLGDWKLGEAIAQNGRGLTWTDPAGSVNGGNCYNCHRISQAEVSYGTIGPSLYNYGKIHGVSNPDRRMQAWASALTKDAKNAGGKPIWDLVEPWLKSKGTVTPRKLNTPNVVGKPGDPVQ